MSASISLDAASARALLYKNMRTFFLSQNISEVESSLFPLSEPDQQKSIFSISQQIRDELIDRRHVVEFSVVQWLQSDRSQDQVLLAVDTFLQAIFAGEFEPERRTLRQAFIHRLGFDPDELSAAELRQEARRLGLNVSLGDDRLAWLKLMFVHFIEPTLGIDEPLYLTELPDQWRDTHFDKDAELTSLTDVFIDGIKVGSVLGQKQYQVQQSTSIPQSRLLNIVFGLERLLMIILETRQIGKVQRMS